MSGSERIIRLHEDSSNEIFTEKIAAERCSIIRCLKKISSVATMAILLTYSCSTARAFQLQLPLNDRKFSSFSRKVPYVMQQHSSRDSGNVLYLRFQGNDHSLVHNNDCSLHAPTIDLSMNRESPQLISFFDQRSHHRHANFSSRLALWKSNFTPPTPSTQSTYMTILERPILALLDLLSFLTFATIGKASHSAGTGADEINVFQVVWTALPFLLAWYGTAPLMGSYNDNATTSVRQSLLFSIRGWIVAVPLGCVLRGVLKGYFPPTSFFVVSMISTLVIIGTVRAAYTVVDDKLS